MHSFSEEAIFFFSFGDVLGILVSSKPDRLSEAQVSRRRDYLHFAAATMLILIAHQLRFVKLQMLDGFSMGIFFNATPKYFKRIGLDVSCASIFSAQRDVLSL